MSLFEDLKAFDKKEKISFHIPGHKGGSGLNKKFKGNAFHLDVTEFEETDDLQNPKGILLKAEERVAEIFDAGKSFFLTNGSTIGIHAALLASCRKGDKILVDRSCHKSVISAITLIGAKPVFVQQDFHKNMGIYSGMNPKTIKKVLSENPDAVGAVITSPTYYGVCSDISGIAAFLHNENKFLIVDEAHGAHFVFHDAFPKTAISQGADICIQSVHKTLGGLGQSSLLHVNKNSLIKDGEVKRALRTIQTTSPSYLLMTSIDNAVADAKDEKEKFDAIVSRVSELKAKVRKNSSVEFVDSRTIGKPQDILRLVADFRKVGISGQYASSILKEKGIYPEMADRYHVVFVITAANTKGELKTLEEELINFSKTKIESSADAQPQSLPDVNLDMIPQDAWYSDRESVAVEDAEGRISADIVSVCPPGAAVIVPGQVIDKKTIDYLKTMGVTEEIEVIK